MDCMKLNMDLHFWKTFGLSWGRNHSTSERENKGTSQQIQSWLIYLAKFPKWFRVELSFQILENRMAHEETPPDVHKHNSWMVTIISRGLRENRDRNPLTLRWGFSSKGDCSWVCLREILLILMQTSQKETFSPPPLVSFCHLLKAAWGNFTGLLSGNPCPCGVIYGGYCWHETEMEQ